MSMEQDREFEEPNFKSVFSMGYMDMRHFEVGEDGNVCAFACWDFSYQNGGGPTTWGECGASSAILPHRAGQLVVSMKGAHQAEPNYMAIYVHLSDYVEKAEQYR